jgi:hypothetical protein
VNLTSLRALRLPGAGLVRRKTLRASIGFLRPLFSHVRKRSHAMFVPRHCVVEEGGREGQLIAAAGLPNSGVSELAVMSSAWITITR